MKPLVLIIFSSSVHQSHLIKPLPCPHCSYVAKKVVHFNRHIREVHTMDRVFSCPEYGCNLSFKRACTLEIHSRIHLNIKPYQCKWCDFTGRCSIMLSPLASFRKFIKYTTGDLRLARPCSPPHRFKSNSHPISKNFF